MTGPLTLHDDLALLLADDLRGEELLFMPFPGNAGDAMIAAATCQMLRRAGLRWRMIGRKTPAAAMRGRMVLFGGGGNLTPWYEDAAAALSRANGMVRRGVLAPHSVLGREGLLAALGPEFTLIARERTSAAHLRAHAGRAGTLLMHDMALSLDVEELFARPLPPGALSGLGRRGPMRILRAARRGARLRLPDGAALDAFRADGEAAGPPPPPRNLDVSVLLSGPVVPELAARMAAARLLRALGRHELVRTDRLHVMIGALLMGKRVEARDNSYGKLRAVHAHSLAGRLGEVRWLDARPDAPPDPSPGDAPG